MTSGTSENTIFRPVLLHPMLSNARLLKGTDSCDFRFYHLSNSDLGFLFTIAFVFVFVVVFHRCLS